MTAARLLSTFALMWLLAGASRAEAARNTADLERDQRDHPQEIMDFAGIAPGMQVLDLFGGAGYYSELLAARVGVEGQVILLNNPPYQSYTQKGMDERVADGRLQGVDRRVADAATLALTPNSLDRVVMVMAFHDLYWVDEKEGWPAIDRAGVIEQIAHALKPGGGLLIVDHAAQAGSDDQAVNALHRIDEAFVRREVEAHGLAWQAGSDILRNPDDDHSLHVFNDAVLGHTDRFVQFYRKPE